MKNVMKVIIILTIFSWANIFAETNLEFANPIIEFDKIDNYNLQGFTTTDKYLFMVLVSYDDTKSIIKVYDLETNNLIKEYNFSSLGHANDVTYNSKENLIYVLDSGGSNVIHKFSNDTFEYIESFSTSLPGRSITYIDKCDCYAIRTVSVGFILDNAFSLNSKIPFIIGMNIKRDLGRQGWSYYNDYIYYTNWSWIRLGGDGSNLIYVYDLRGDNKDILYIKNDIGEIEGVSFYDNKMLLGFNGYDEKIKFYTINIPDIPKEVINNIDEEVEIDDSSDEKMQNKMIIVVIFIIAFFLLLFILSFIIIRQRKKYFR